MRYADWLIHKPLGDSLVDALYTMFYSLYTAVRCTLIVGIVEALANGCQ